MTTSVEHNVERSRYELLIDGRLTGFANYQLRGDVIVFPHTEILGEMRGNGLGAVLVKAALDDVRGTGRRIVPACWYVAEFIDEHTEYRDLVADG
jgi:predicted GNAT family acetyltransferase